MASAQIDHNSIPFNFTYFAMKLLGKNLYSNPWTAISELVANGIDSKAENVHVLVDMRNKKNAVVEIFDDGDGMSYADLRDKYTVIGRNKRNRPAKKSQVENSRYSSFWSTLGASTSGFMICGTRSQRWHWRTAWM